MSEDLRQGPPPRGGGPDPHHAPAPAIEKAARQIRAPWAASIAGLLFAACFTGAMVLVRSQSWIDADDEELAAAFAAGEDLGGIIGGLYLAPLAGIMFLWFIAVVRDQIGDREDRFFATGFLGSGLLFVAIMFAAMAVASAPLVGHSYLGLGPPSAAEVDSAQKLGYTFMFAFGTRAAAVFVFALSTVGFRGGVFPRWFARAGYLLGVILLVFVAFLDWVILIFPAWIALVSLYIIRLERSRHAPSER